MDAYRLAGCADLDEMGFDECLSGKGVMIIEWAERIQKAIPADALFVAMSYIEEKKRKIEMSSCSEKMRFWEGTLKKGGF
jgi:tRNA threonylcarbamoyladenosine biosynthesis protein TsaE